MFRYFRSQALKLGGVVGVSLFIGLLWLLLGELPKNDIPSNLSEKEKRELVNSNRETILKVLQTIGGLGFIGTAYLAWRNSQLIQDKNLANRFGKAVEMLSDAKLEIRLGGIYLLEKIARESKEDHPIVMEVLSAFVRERTKVEEYRQLEKPEADIQSALTVIGRRNPKNDKQPLDLSHCHLEQAQLNRANFQGVLLDGANFRQAQLNRASLQQAQLKGAYFQAAQLNEANLQGAQLSDANLKWAQLNRANLEQAQLEKTNLQQAQLNGANFQQAQLNGANLQGALLCKANLQGALLNEANFWQAQLNEANLRQAQLHKTNLQQTQLYGANLQQARLTRVNLQWAQLGEANLQQTQLNETNLEKAGKLTEGQLSQAYLCQAILPEGIPLDPNRDCKP